MNRLGLMVAAALLGVTMSTASSFVPPTADQAFAQTREERATTARERRIAARERRAAVERARRAKRAECRREAKAQKLGVIKSLRFVNACMKRA
jgi:hypothetical protein